MVKTWIVGAVMICLGGALAPTYAQEPSAVFDPMTLPAQQESLLPLLDRILAEPGEAERYLGLASFINTYGEWVELSSASKTLRVHLITYLLQQDKQQEAIALVKSGDVKGWLTYQFQNGVANDFMFAMDTGRFDYVLGLIEHAPQGVNSAFPVTVQGDTITPLAMLATAKYRDAVQYEVIVRALLRQGANPHQQLSNGLSPLIIAASANNNLFSRIVHAFDSEQKGATSDLMRNTPLNDTELLEMQAIADALIERQASGDDNYSFDKLHQLWIQMIIKGYNTPADLIYERLLSYKEFNVDYHKGSNGLTGLMAATLSSVYGGNVEYAQRLLQRGADPKALIDVGTTDAGEPTRVNLIQLALQNDNYKVVALLIQNGVNFVLLPDNEEVLILSSAMEQRAFKSAYVIREALTSSFAKMAE